MGLPACRWRGLLRLMVCRWSGIMLRDCRNSDLPTWPYPVWVGEPSAAGLPMPEVEFDDLSESASIAQRSFCDPPQRVPWPHDHRVLWGLRPIVGCLVLGDLSLHLRQRVGGELGRLCRQHD